MICNWCSYPLGGPECVCKCDVHNVHPAGCDDQHCYYCNEPMDDSTGEAWCSASCVDFVAGVL